MFGWVREKLNPSSHRLRIKEFVSFKTIIMAKPLYKDSDGSGETHSPKQVHTNTYVFCMAILQNLTVIAALSVAFGVGTTGKWLLDPNAQVGSTPWTTVVVVLGAMVGWSHEEDFATPFDSRLNERRLAVPVSNTIWGAIPTALASFCGTAFITLLAMSTSLHEVPGYTGLLANSTTALICPMSHSNSSAYSYLAAGNCTTQPPSLSASMATQFYGRRRPEDATNIIVQPVQSLTSLPATNRLQSPTGILYRVHPGSVGSPWISNSVANINQSAVPHDRWTRHADFAHNQVCAWTLGRNPIRCQTIFNKISMFSPTDDPLTVSDGASAVSLTFWTESARQRALLGLAPTFSILSNSPSYKSHRSPFNLSYSGSQWSFYFGAAQYYNDLANGNQSTAKYGVTRCQTVEDFDDSWVGRTLLYLTSDDATSIQVKDMGIPCVPTYRAMNRSEFEIYGMSTILNMQLAGALLNDYRERTFSDSISDFQDAFGTLMGLEAGRLSTIEAVGKLDPSRVVPVGVVFTVTTMGSFSKERKTPWLVMMLIPASGILLTFVAGITLVPHWDLSDPNVNLAVPLSHERSEKRRDDKSRPMFLRVEDGMLKATVEEDGLMIQRGGKY
ncbi:hypothetical protein T439DRAFT_349450 [Meredithblackwellia eburnea MCA 4105]